MKNFDRDRLVSEICVLSAIHASHSTASELVAEIVTTREESAARIRETFLGSGLISEVERNGLIERFGSLLRSPQTRLRGVETVGEPLKQRASTGSPSSRLGAERRLIFHNNINGLGSTETTTVCSLSLT